MLDWLFLVKLQNCGQGKQASVSNVNGGTDMVILLMLDFHVIILFYSLGGDESRCDKQHFFM